MQVHYVQTCCHKYSTRPLLPSWSRLQEVVPSFCCLQRVFLCAKPKGACEPHCLSLVATSSSLGLRANMTSPIKPEIRNISLCRQKMTEPWPLVTRTKDLVKIGRVVLKILSWTDKHTHTNRHAHHNIFAPLSRRNNKHFAHTCCLNVTAEKAQFLHSLVISRAHQIFRNGFGFWKFTQ